MKSLVFAAVAAISLPAVGAPVFRNPLPVAQGTSSAMHLMRADFNGDQREDVLIVGDELKVLLSNGSGPFAAPVSTPAGSQYVLPAIGDVNGDGRRDIIAAATNDDTRFVVKLGNGDGSFTDGSSYDVGVTGTRGFALGHFNADSHLDVAASAGSIVVHFGDGAGHFTVGPSTGGGTTGLGLMSAADMNGDGRADLVVEHAGIFLNQGAGTFVRSAFLNEWGDVRVHDFNRDGKLDVALAAGGSPHNSVMILMGNGDGTLGAPVNYVAGYEARSLDLADLNSDGSADLCLASGTAGTVSVLLGNADGTFQPTRFFLTGPGSWEVVAADFDHDDDVDIVTTGTGGLSLVRGNGDGTFATSRAWHTNPNVPVSFGGLGARSVAVADMNHDSAPDVVLIQSTYNASTMDVAVLLNDGTGALGAPILTPGTSASGMTVADVNNDQNLDVVTVISFPGSHVQVFLGNGQGGFAPQAPFEIAYSGTPFVGQFDADPNPDLFIAYGHGVSVHPGNGNGTFGAPVTTVGDGYDVSVGDLNGDGKLDYLSSFVNRLVVQRNDGSGRFTPALISTDSVRLSILGDVNGDAKPDILTSTVLGLQTRFGAGDGTFGAPVQFRIEPEPIEYDPGARTTTTTADVDGDGKTDAIFGTRVFHGNGDGTFRSRSLFRTTELDSVAVGDLDGSGSIDVVALALGVDDVDVLLTRTTADPTQTPSIALASDIPVPRYGERVHLTATVTGPIPFRGVVRFTVDGVDTALVDVGEDGKAVFDTAFTVGAHSIVATYTGDENYVDVSTPMNLTVTKGLPQILINGSPNPAALTVRVYVNVSFSAPVWYGLPRATGTITLRDGDTLLGQLPLSQSAQTSFTNFMKGTHVITAEYPGDENFEAVSVSYTQEISKPVPHLSVTLTPSTNIVAGTTVTIDASLFHSLGTSGISGTMTLLVFGNIVATAPVVNGAARFERSFAPGNYSIQLNYSGDDTWAGASAERSFSVYLPAGAAPAPMASASTATSASLLWFPVLGASSYTVWRKTSHAAPWEALGTTSQNFYSVAMPANTTWLFALTVKDTNGNTTAMGPPDLATTKPPYTDPTIFQGVTGVKAAHFNELRAAIQSVRTFAGLGAYPYTNAIAAGQVIRAIDLEEMRTAIAQGRAVIGVQAFSFSGTAMIRAQNVHDLRGAVD